MEPTEIGLNALTVVATALVIHFVTLRSTRRRTMNEAVVHKQLETVENVVTAVTNTSRALNALVASARASDSGRDVEDPELLRGMDTIFQETGKVIREYFPKMNLYLDSRFVTPWEVGMSVRSEALQELVERGRRGVADSAVEKQMLKKVQDLANEFEWMATQLALISRATSGVATRRERKFMRWRTIEKGSATEWAQRIRGKHLQDERLKGPSKSGPASTE